MMLVCAHTSVLENQALVDVLTGPGLVGVGKGHQGKVYLQQKKVDIPDNKPGG